MNVLTEERLTQEANKFLKEVFDTELSVPLKINNRLSRTLGRFKSTYRDPISVELGGYFVRNNEPSTVLDVLKHELVHYALFKRKEPNDDGHPHFEDTLKRLGIVSQTNITNKIQNLKTKPRKKIVYQCQGCKTEFKRSKRLPNNGAYHHCKGCGKEKGKLKEIK